MEKSEDERQPPNVIVSDTDNATKIPAEEAPPDKEQKFKWFRLYNNGTYNGPKREIKEVTHRQDNLQRFDALASSISLTDYQKDRGRHLLDNLDLQDIGLKIDAVIFAVCVLVANEDSRNGSRYYPNEHRSDDKQFRKVADSINLSQSQQASVIEKIRHRVDL